MEKFVKIVLYSLVFLIVIMTLGFYLIILGLRPGAVSDEIKNACLHYNNQEVVSEVIRARTNSIDDWNSFSVAQDVAEKNGILIDFTNITLEKNIWMVPLTQRVDNNTKQLIALLDCQTDTVEFGIK
ncbi:hypothetical protein [Erwinia mallotivora]|uniref:Uncharacterized protein n=1 Tax=Erwinia mallotivora TaxID=69222 RepID=A0A014M4Z3_9GAMM|nr:hypothetical protein [Erwinia mallotivora]EXU76896.1 hypothetical protein BG55_03110 [Erwinia mallotivora]